MKSSMATESPEIPTLAAEAEAPPSVRIDGLRRALQQVRLNLALQDYIVFIGHFLILLRVAFAPDGHDASIARFEYAALLAVTSASLFLVRSGIVASSYVRAWIYRGGVLLSLPAAYFTMRHLLPALEPRLLDAELMRIDEWLFFGTTPSVWLDQHLASYATVEWFSFCYYLYFILLLLNQGGTAVFDRGRRQREMMFGTMLVGFGGYFGYTLVPGLGPYATLHFAPLSGGFWWSTVSHTVSSAGAQLDIFPSLHTAQPCFFALHAIRYRRTRPYKWLWVPATFIALNIVVATMLLRWHWGIDVIAGLVLAFLAQRLGIAASRFEEARARPDRQAVWEQMWGAYDRT